MSPLVAAPPAQSTTWDPFHPVRRTSGSQWVDVSPVAGRGWLAEAMRKVSELAARPENWDGFGSPPLQRAAVEGALDLLNLIWALNGDLARPAIAPVSGGGIQVEWQTAAGFEIELEVLPDGSVVFLKVHNGEPVEEGDLDTSDLGAVIRLLDWGVQA